MDILAFALYFVAMLAIGVFFFFKSSGLVKLVCFVPDTFTSTDLRIVSTNVEQTKLNLSLFFVPLPNKEYKRFTKLYLVFSLFLI